MTHTIHIPTGMTDTNTNMQQIPVNVYRLQCSLAHALCPSEDKDKVLKKQLFPAHATNKFLILQ